MVLIYVVLSDESETLVRRRQGCGVLVVTTDMHE